ncbi:beige/BEACH domain protein, putative [Plasmodium ovale]|nr:beige/BEACH domain protein, putative [Plasmodium ovale]
MEKEKIRCFNLLFLEEDEEYMDDLLTTMRRGCGTTHQGEASERVEENIRGRLRLCSKSLIFEPYNVEEEVLKFPFRKLENVKLDIVTGELVVKTLEVIRIKTIIYNRKTRCTSQFAYDRKNKKNQSTMSSCYDDLLDEIRGIDNDNIDEKILLFEGLLNNFSAPYDAATDSGTCVDAFVYSFQCDGAVGSAKKLRMIYDSVVKIKIAMIVHEKQMELLIREKKKRQVVEKQDQHQGQDLAQEEAQKAAEKIAQKTAEKTAEKTAQKTAEKTAQKAAEKTQKQSEEQIAQLNLEKYTEEMLEKITKEVKFDISSIGIHEKIITKKIEGFWVFKISPLLKMKGILNITDKYIYFQPYPNCTNKKEKKWKIENILHIFKRILTMKPNSIEIIFDHDKKKYVSLYIEFVNIEEREIIIDIFKNIKKDYFYIDENKRFKYEIQKKWINGYISNYEYIDFLNCIGGRSRNDFSQYPIFPWILCNYTNMSLNLDDNDDDGGGDDNDDGGGGDDNNNIYRNLCKPIGSLNVKRLNCLVEKMYDEHNYFYGSHYSTLAYVIYFLIRLYPECQLKLQSGKFDTISRMFLSIENTFNTVLNGNSSFIELIPEFYENNDNFLKNTLNITTNEGFLNDVILPPWCLNSNDFLIKMKNALESFYVNNNLHEWINLIFGYKQIGEIAKDNFNVFHPLTYMHTILYDKLSNTYMYNNTFNRSRADEYNEFENCFNNKIKSLITTMSPKALKTQLHEFGQCPFQLFKKKHPPRNSSIPFKYNPNIKNYFWYYSPVVKQLLRDFSHGRKGRHRFPQVRPVRPVREHGEYSHHSDPFSEHGDPFSEHDDPFSEHGDPFSEHGDPILASDRSCDESLNHSEWKKNGSVTEKIRTSEQIRSGSMEICTQGKGEGDSNYFTTHTWSVQRVDNLTCVVNAVSSTDTTLCFVCNNGFVHLINHSHLIKEEIKKNTNFISLKLGNVHFSSVTNVHDNYVMGTWDGHILFLKPQNILKRDTTHPSKGRFEHCNEERDGIASAREVKRREETLRGNKQGKRKPYREEIEGEEAQGGGGPSDHTSVSHSIISSSSESLLSSFDDVFEWDCAEGSCGRAPSRRSRSLYEQTISTKVHNDGVTCMSYGGGYLVTGSSDETIQLINVERGFEIVQTYDRLNHSVKYVQMRNKLLLVRSDELLLFDVRVPKEKILLNNVNGIGGDCDSSFRITGEEESPAYKLPMNKSPFKNPRTGSFFQMYKQSAHARPFYDVVQKVYQRSYSYECSYECSYDYNRDCNCNCNYDYVPLSYTHPKHLFEKRIRNNSNITCVKNITSMIYTSLVSDNIIMCIDENTNFYFYDIRAENWTNINMGSTRTNREKKINKITVASSSKHHLCTVNEEGFIFLEPLNFYTPLEIGATDSSYNGLMSRTNFFNDRCSITPSHISFVNYPNDSIESANGTSANLLSCNYIILTGTNGDIEIHKKND